MDIDQRSELIFGVHTAPSTQCTAYSYSARLFSTSFLPNNVYTMHNVTPSIKVNLIISIVSYIIIIINIIISPYKILNNTESKKHLSFTKYPGHKSTFLHQISKVLQSQIRIV